MAGATVLLDGPIFTGRELAEALLIQDGRVERVGSRRSVLRDTPTGADRRSLGGDVVIPGLIDAHLHLGEIARAALAADLRGAGSMAALKNRVQTQALHAPTGPVLGHGWDQEELREQRYPTRHDLDRWVRDRPVLLLRICDHAGVVNSLALDVAGIQAGTPDPVGGKIGRDPNGAPNGLLFDRALAAVRPLWEQNPLTPDLLAGSLRALAPYGLTTIGSVSSTPDEVRAAAAIPIGRRDVSVRFFLRAGARDQVDPLRRELTDPSVQIGGLKLVTDGAFGARTAWLAAPYSDAPDEVGTPIGSSEEISEAVEFARERALAIALHAIGDRAVDRIVSVLERRPYAKARVEHASLLTAPLVERIARLGVTLVVQPGFIASDFWLPERLGPRRLRWAYPFGTLLRRGVPLAYSSDAPVDPVDPWRGFRVAVERSDRGRSGAPRVGERLTAIQAVTLATASAGAPVGCPEAGILAEGAPADFVLLRAPSIDEAVRRGAATVRETWKAGRMTYAARPGKGPMK